LKLDAIHAQGFLFWAYFFARGQNPHLN